MEQLHAEELAYYRDAAMEADKKRKEMEQLMGSLRLELNAEREARLLCMEELDVWRNDAPFSPCLRPFGKRKQTENERSH